LLRNAKLPGIEERIREEAQAFRQRLDSAEARAAFEAFLTRK
jgi:hypothetical protein